MKDIRITLFAALFVLQGNSTAQSVIEPPDSLYARAWRYQALAYPLDILATKDDPRLPDMRPEAIVHRQMFWENVLQQLSRYDTDTLSGQDRINYEVFRYIVEDNAAGYRLGGYLMPFNAEGGFHTDFGFIPGWHPFRTQSDYDRYVVKLNSFPEFVEQHIALLRRGIAEGFTMPAAIMRDFDQTAMAFVHDEAESSVFYGPFERIPASVEGAEVLRGRGDTAVVQVMHAYRRLAEFLRDEYIPACRQSIGAVHLPGGEEYYAQRVRHFTTLDLTAAEIYETGMAEVTRIRREMERIIDSLGFDGTFAEFLAFLRTDPRFYARSARELLMEASYFSKKIDGKLPQYFGKLPRLPYGVEPVPAAIAPRYTGGRYAPGSYAQHRAGAYWVNTFKLESRPLYVLPALTLHEAVPGHHLQISLAAEAEYERAVKLPEFRNSYYISAFGEGWALYTEWLGKEMGIYEDLYQHFGALTYEMWRACRLVVDPGMHAMGWTRERALQFLSENTALSLHEVTTEIDRYIGWPGQAVSYKIGELKIRALRREAEQHMGDRFDLRTFHDVILENGSVPLFVLERTMQEWMTEMLKQ